MNAGAGDPLRVVMIGSRLPSRSETFVYRELLALRALGVDIRPASVRTPDASDLAPEARALAAEAIPIYGNGRGWWLGVLLALVWPAAWRVFWRAHRDAWRRMPRARADAMEAADPPAPAGPLTMRDRVALFTQAAGAVALAWRVRGFRPQLIHAHLAHVPCTIAMYTAEALRVPFAFTGHAAGLFRDGRLLDLKAARAAFVGCISAWHRDWMVRAFGVDTAKLPIIRCGVDVDEAKTRASGEPASAGGACPGSAPPAEAVSPGHAQARPFRIVTVGRLVPKKGLDLLIAAFARCLEHGSLPAASELVIVGDGPERDRLAALAAELGIAERLAWRGGLPHAEALGAIRSGDVFALLARPAADGDRDGVPVVLMEAMAAGGTGFGHREAHRRSGLWRSDRRARLLFGDRVGGRWVGRLTGRNGWRPRPHLASGRHWWGWRTRSPPKAWHARRHPPANPARGGSRRRGYRAWPLGVSVYRNSAGSPRKLRGKSDSAGWTSRRSRPRPRPPHPDLPPAPPA